MAAIISASVWSATGLDRLRPKSVDDALNAWMFFGRFGALHWRTGDGSLKAHPAVEGNAEARVAAQWARSAYEQLPAYWVFLLCQAAGSDVFRCQSGQDGWMLCDRLEHSPHVLPAVVDEAAKLLGRHVMPGDAWNSAVEEFAGTVNTEDVVTCGQRSFPVTIHLMGAAKAGHANATAVLLAYEILRVRFEREVPDGQSRTPSFGDHLSTTYEHRFLSGLEDDVFFDSVASRMHTDMCHEYVYATSRSPEQIVVYCPGLSKRLPTKKWFPNSVVFVVSSGKGFGLTGFLPDDCEGNPRTRDVTDESVARLLFHFGEEFEAEGAFTPFQNLRSRVGREVFVSPPPAHFRPADDTLISYLSARLGLFKQWAAEKFPNKKMPLHLFGESAGTHTAVAVHEILTTIGWKPNRVVRTPH